MKYSFLYRTIKKQIKKTNMYAKGCFTNIKQTIVAMLLLLLVPYIASAQYFGQNKMRYKKLDFNVKETPHFEMYSYLKNDSMMTWLARNRRFGTICINKCFRILFYAKIRLLYITTIRSFSRQRLYLVKYLSVQVG